jgi:hypothetical protein
MPSIIPSYVYSLFAALIIGTILVYSCSAVTLNVRNQADRQQLANIGDYIAVQGLFLVSNGNNQNISQFLQIPASIGRNQYWIALENDSSGAWVELGFGTKVGHTTQTTYIPAKIEASGTFISSSGRPVLKYFVENQSLILKLVGE